MKNKVLNKIEVFPSIISEIKKSEREILIVSEWFADIGMFDILLKKREQGVSIKLIIEDDVYYDANKFSGLIKVGVVIYRINMDDFGLMHKRYCIVDGKTAIFPLVNWSPYFLVRSHESLIITGHQKTVQTLKSHFFKIKGKAKEIGKDDSESSIFARIKNRVLKLFGFKPKEVRKTTVIDIETSVKPKNEIKFKIINTSVLVDDEFDSFFFHPN